MIKDIANMYSRTLEALKTNPKADFLAIAVFGVITGFWYHVWDQKNILEQGTPRLTNPELTTKALPPSILTTLAIPLLHCVFRKGVEVVGGMFR